MASADWNPGDDHKMHWPQLPDPNGWDVNMTNNPLADDWRCSQTGPVDDIHFWVSWLGDLEGEIAGIELAIFSDDRSGDYSKPGDLLWSDFLAAGQFQYRFYGEGLQGWYSPSDRLVLPQNHNNTYQINITNIAEPFIQQVDTIYWLGIKVNNAPGIAAQPLLGWKTSISQPFEDDAVYWDSDYYTNGYDRVDTTVSLGAWKELVDPFTGASLDLAFVITPEPTTMLLLTAGGILLVRKRR